VEPPERLFAVAVLEASYIGTRGTHLVRERSLNQALSASANNPIRGLNAPTLSCARVGTSYCRMRSTECAKNEKSTGAPRSVEALVACDFFVVVTAPFRALCIPRTGDRIQTDRPSAT
jgi:hypothetical protein